MHIIPSLLALTALVAGPVLAAEDGNKPVGEHPKHEQGKGGPADRMKKFDTNGDGTLDDTEKAAARTAFADNLKKEHPEAFKKADTNGDGTLSEDEMKAAREKMRERQEEMKKKADTNGDGKLDEEERKAFRKKMKDEGDFGGKPERKEGKEGKEGKPERDGGKREHGKKHD